MAETPEERLARLRRELEADDSAPATRAASPIPAAPAPTPAPVAVTPPAGVSSAPVPPSPAPTRPASSAPGAAPITRPVTPERVDAERPKDDGWSLSEALGGAGLGTWIGIGLVVIGGYLVLAQLFPGLSLPGSLIMAGAGVVLLWLHFTHRQGAWALYAGAVLTAVGVLRVVGDLLPFTVNGETALGLGGALLAIGYLRHTQAGGYGWQGAVGVVVLGFGALQLVLGLLPGSPGILDLVLPLLILGGGVLLLTRALGRRSA